MRWLRLRRPLRCREKYRARLTVESLEHRFLLASVIWEPQHGGNGHVYEAVRVSVTWSEANQLAQQAGGHLATIQSAAENEFVFNLIDAPEFWTNFGYPDYSWGPWLGGFQAPGSVEPSGGWQWVTGEPFSYTNWRPGEPSNNAGAEDYLHFFTTPAAGRAPTWNDFFDAESLRLWGYVVEYDNVVNVTLGTVTAGESLTLEFDAVVNTPLPKGITQLSNQGTVWGADVWVTTNPVVLPLDRAPQVTDVFVRSTATPSVDGWYPGFLTYLENNGLGDATLGFRVPDSGEQLKPLPWASLNELSIRFDEDVNVQFDDLQLLGSNVGVYQLDSAAFTYDATTFTATWRLDDAVNPVIGADKLRIVLDGSPGGVIDAAGHQLLDGNWEDGTALFPSGDGVPGDDFSYRFNVMPGDADRNTGVTIFDVWPLRSNFGRVAGEGLYDYNHFADLDGNGGITIFDIFPLRNNLGRRLPSTEPGGTAGSGWIPALPPPAPLGPGSQSATISATKTARLEVDHDADGVADPGDTIRYKLTIINSSATDAAQVQFDDALGPHLTLADSAVTTTRYPPPRFDVITQPGFREGDSFQVMVNNAAPCVPVDVEVIGDNNVTEAVFDAYALTTDDSGHGTFTLTFPYVLAPGFVQDSRTIRVSVGGVSQQFVVLVLEGIRVSVVTPDTNGNITEGDSFTVDMRHGIGESRVIVQLIAGNDVVEHEYGFMETNGSGEFNRQFQIPELLIGLDHTVDGRTVRVIHGDYVGDFLITVHEGLRISVGHKKTREGHTFPLEVRNGIGESKIDMSWYHDGNYVKEQPGFYETDGSGYAARMITTPNGLIQNAADADYFTLRVTHAGETWEFGLTVFKGSTPDPEGPAPRVNKPANSANGQNSVPPDSLVRLKRDYQNGTPLATLKARVPQDVADYDPFWNKRIVHGGRADTLQRPSSKTPGLTFQSLTKPMAEQLADQYGDAVVVLDSTPRTRYERASKTLVVLGLGRGQEIGDGSPFNLLYNRLGLPHVKIFPTADCHPILCAINPIEAYERTQRRQEVIDSVAGYIDSLNIKSVVLAGFSYGGGLMYQLGTWLATNRPGVKIIGVAYVDAIEFLPGIGPPQFFLPPGTQSVLNIYQSAGPDLHGSAVFTLLRPVVWPNASPGTIIQWDAETLFDIRPHELMDDIYWDEAQEYVYRIIDQNYPQ